MAEREGADPSFDTALAQALFDPIAWLTELGAKRVIQVRPGGPGLDGSRILSFGPGTGPEISEDVDRAQPVLVRQIDDAVNALGDPTPESARSPTLSALH